VIVQIPRLHRIFIFQVVCQRIRLYAESHLNIWLALLHKLTKVNNEWGSCSNKSNCAVAGSCLEYMAAPELEDQNNVLIVYTEGLLVAVCLYGCI